MKKNNYISPEVEMIKLCSKDVVTTSPVEGDVEADGSTTDIPGGKDWD